MQRISAVCTSDSMFYPLIMCALQIVFMIMIMVNYQHPRSTRSFCRGSRNRHLIRLIWIRTDRYQTWALIKACRTGCCQTICGACRTKPPLPSKTVSVQTSPQFRNSSCEFSEWPDMSSWCVNKVHLCSWITYLEWTEDSGRTEVQILVRPSVYGKGKGKGSGFI